jgi:hypothetical protein
MEPENGLLDRWAGFTKLTRVVAESGEPYKKIQCD